MLRQGNSLRLVCLLSDSPQGSLVTVFFLEGGRPTFGPRAAELTGDFYKNLCGSQLFANRIQGSLQTAQAVSAIQASTPNPPPKATLVAAIQSKLDQAPARLNWPKSPWPIHPQPHRGWVGNHDPNQRLSSRLRADLRCFPLQSSHEAKSPVASSNKDT